MLNGKSPFTRLNKQTRSDFIRVCRHLMPHLQPHHQTLRIAAVCMLGATLMELLKPWPLKFVFDVLLVGDDRAASGFQGWLGSLSPATSVSVIATMILSIAILAGLFGYGQSYLTASVGQKVVADIRERVYAHLQRLSHSFHDDSSTGDLLARLTGDIRMMRELLVNSVIYISDRSLVVIGMLGIMLWMDWMLTLVALVILPVLVLLVFRFSGEIKVATRRQRKKESKISHAIAEKLTSITLIQAFAREAYEDSQFARYNSKSTQAGLVTTRLEANMNRLVQVLLAAGTAVVIAFGVFRVHAGILTPGDLLVFTAYLTGLYKPVRKLSSITSRIAKATACGERVVSILETRPQIIDGPEAIPARQIQGQIVFDEVTFFYSGEIAVLEQATIQINPGEHLLLCGQSGAGKSTVTRLLLRFYDPVSGAILLDGRDTRNYTLETLRNQFAVVLQESVLFNASIYDNIGYGRLDASEAEIKAAARAANAHEFIMALPEGYDSIVNERGASLSGGQRQRIAIARAIVRDAPIVILDEPLTGLDALSREKVESALVQLTRDRTCLTITHDLSTAVHADRMVELVNGRFVELTIQPNGGCISLPLRDEAGSA